jgi:hypothetical protein
MNKKDKQYQSKLKSFTKKLEGFKKQRSTYLDKSELIQRQIDDAVFKWYTHKEDSVDIVDGEYQRNLYKLRQSYSEKYDAFINNRDEVLTELIKLRELRQSLFRLAYEEIQNPTTKQKNSKKKALKDLAKTDKQDNLLSKKNTIITNKIIKLNEAHKKNKLKLETIRNKHLKQYAKITSSLRTKLDKLIKKRNSRAPAYNKIFQKERKVIQDFNDWCRNNGYPIYVIPESEDESESEYEPEPEPEPEPPIRSNQIQIKHFKYTPNSTYTANDLKQNFRQLVLKNHPDKNPKEPVKYGEITKQIYNEYDYLKQIKGYGMRF